MSVLYLNQRNYILYKNKNYLNIVEVQNNKVNYKKCFVNEHNYKTYIENNNLYILTKNKILLIDNLSNAFKQNKLLINRFQDLLETNLSHSCLIPLKDILIYLSKTHIYIIYIYLKKNNILLKKIKNNIDIEHIKFCKKKYINISFDQFSLLFSNWFRKLYNLVKNENHLLLLLETFKNLLENSFSFIYKQTNISFFKIIYIKDDLIYILGNSKIIIFNYILRIITWKVDISYYLNRYNYNDILLYGGTNDYCYFVLTKRTELQIFFECFLINNTLKTLMPIYNHEYWFSDYLFFENVDIIKKIKLNCVNDLHFINYSLNNKSYLHFLFSSKKKCFETILFKTIQANNLEQNFLHYKKKFNHIMSDSILTNDDNQKKIINKCCICYENNSNLLFLPCSHYCCCKNCSINLTNCPICRTQIINKRSIFFN
jgi:hypothetical protein